MANELQDRISKLSNVSSLISISGKPRVNTFITTPTSTPTETPTPTLTPTETPTPTYPPIANMSALSTDSLAYQNPGEQVYLQGYYNEGDGGEGLFTFDSTSFFDDDSGAVVRPSNIGSNSSGRWLRQFSNNYASAEMWGAYGDGQNDDRPYISRAIDYVCLSGSDIDYTLNLNSKTYFLSSYDLKGSTSDNNDFLYTGPFYVAPYILIGYYPTRNYKHKFSLLGTGNTILCASNFKSKAQYRNSSDGYNTWENGIQTVLGNRTFVSLRSSVTGCTFKGIEFVADGYNNGYVGGEYVTINNVISAYPNGISYSKSSTGGFEIGSDNGCTWGTLPSANPRAFVHIHDCTFNNVQTRAINCQTATIPGSGTQLVSVTGCDFLYPKGCDSPNTGGGSQSIQVISDTRKFVYADNYAEGTSYVPVQCGNGLPVDGAFLGGALDTTIARNTFERFSIETLNMQNYSPYRLYVNTPSNPSYSIQPAVGNQTTLEIAIDNNQTSYNTFCAATATMYRPGDICKLGYFGYVQGGIYQINSWSGSLPTFYATVTRLSGSGYGDAAFVSQDMAVGQSLAGRHLDLFDLRGRYGQNNNIIDNVFAFGLSISASPLFRYNGTVIGAVTNAHNPCVRSDGYQNYLSGNTFNGGVALLLLNNSNPGATTIIENNIINVYNMLPQLHGPSPATPSYLVSAINSNSGLYYPLSIAMSGAIVRNNDFYYWKDFNGNTATQLNSAFPQSYINFGAVISNTANLLADVPYNGVSYIPVKFFGVTLNYGVNVSIPQSVYDNTLHVSIPLSANLITFTTNDPSFNSTKTIFNNNIV